MTGITWLGLGRNPPATWAQMGSPVGYRPEFLDRHRTEFSDPTDLVARRVIAWEAAEHIRTDLPLAALRRAIRLRRPAPDLIHHSDRGCQYGSSEYVNELMAHGIRPSMSRRGNCCDNAVAESFFGSMKIEALDREVWDTPDAARRALETYIDGFYNKKRRHNANGGRSPVNHEAAFRAREAAAS